MRAPIVVLSGRRFPTGSHKVGPAYSILVEKQLDGACAPGEQTLVFPSTGNFGIGGAWVGPRMGYRSRVVLPAADERRALREDPRLRRGRDRDTRQRVERQGDLRQGPRAARGPGEPDPEPVRGARELPLPLPLHGGRGRRKRPSSLRLRGRRRSSRPWARRARSRPARACAVQHPGLRVVAVEPMQCPTLYDVGFGAHRIEGIGDKHVTWIHNVWATDLLVCVDDLECLEGLQLLQEGTAQLEAEGVDAERARAWVGFFGISGVCNVLGGDPRGRPLRLRPAAGGGDRGHRRLRPLPLGSEAARRRAGEDGRWRRRATARDLPLAAHGLARSRARPRRAAAGTTRSTSPGSSSRARASPSCGRRRTRPGGWPSRSERTRSTAASESGALELPRLRQRPRAACAAGGATRAASTATARPAARRACSRSSSTSRGRGAR